MTKQQELRSLFRVITADLAEFKIPFVFTNHTYATIGAYVPGQTISGGGGAIYNASIITLLSKATLKEGVEDNPMGVQKTGIVVTSKIAKNRFARPIPVKFHISFYKGMNPFVGLETFINWENCGIQRGKLIDEAFFEKWYTKGGPADEAVKSTRFVHTDENGKEKVYYFEAKDKGRKIAVRHLAQEVSPNELFTSKVLIREVLETLDENVIKKTFMLPNITDLNEIEDLEFMDVLDEE